MPDIQQLLLDRLTAGQTEAVKSDKRRVLVVAGAGSGKTEVMARRIAWWVGVKGVPKDRIVAFTFTERAAEEMKFRIRSWLARIVGKGQEVVLGGMYIGTIHGFCLAKLREFWPDDYHNYDVLDEAARTALILRGFNGVLGLSKLRSALGGGQYATVEAFTQGYDQLHEHLQFRVQLGSGDPPYELGAVEGDWCKEAALVTKVGSSEVANAFSVSAARYYAYLRCRRFLDFSTSQSEFIRRLDSDKTRRETLQQKGIFLVVDEVQDINPAQERLIDLLVGASGHLTAVGDHRQSIYGFRGAKVSILGDLWKKFKAAADADIVDLQENFRSTPRLIALANAWAKTITPIGVMQTPPMKHGNTKRQDYHPSHVALVGFPDRVQEADWIAKAIRVIAPSEAKGAKHDKKDGLERGLTLSDIAVLVRSSTDVRTYMQALERAGIPCIVRAGPDLFSQPEVLFFLSALALTAGTAEFYGAPQNPKSLPGRINAVLGCSPKPLEVLREAAKALRKAGLTLAKDTETRLVVAADLIARRIHANGQLAAAEVSSLRTPKLRAFLKSKNELRRVFPQQLFHWLLTEAEVESWDKNEGRGQAALYHLGALSGLITGLETPGWTSAKDYPWQIVGLCQYGADEGRPEEQPLMVQPDAVRISTIHAVKGLEFAAVFLADVNSRRFPSQFAKRTPNLPMEGKILKAIDAEGLADNDNYDGERRLMYVAMTRSERFLFISHSSKNESKFVTELTGLVGRSGGLVTADSNQLLRDLKYAPKEHHREIRLATSFSDLRYFLACPHDFYLRKVLGFAPTIDQAFGYGRGVHNLMRAVHSDPAKWAKLAGNRSALEKEIQNLIDKGLFYLRYTTGDPAKNMREKGVRIVADYIGRYASELATLEFEPEKEFETLIEYEDGDGGALVSGAIDIVRQDNPPRVTLIDFKSGNPESDNHQKLDENEMQLQVALYAVAARKELEYQPEQGIVRYLDADDPTKSELTVPLDEAALQTATKTVAVAAAEIRDRTFAEGPRVSVDGKVRCSKCDFLGFCGTEEAVTFKNDNPEEI